MIAFIITCIASVVAIALAVDTWRVSRQVEKIQKRMEEDPK